MKNLELKNLGVQEMNANEMTTVEGGGLLNSALNGTLTSAGSLVNSLGTDLSSFLNKTLANVFKFVWSL
ncbi:hypothetical protein [Pedobacter sp. MC2016-24]|uniref:hypothetical protein n=1 Tax=Pedobacter sp. MC2016-24 TaxID=2780090 RepID=UPI00187F4D9A|nr:hypothetical protein [Pedobacter sp. MC2016-24]MBE9599085.1 hypothetical protein [Pedobacter sp. MC2016-24]